MHVLEHCAFHVCPRVIYLAACIYLSSWARVTGSRNLLSLVPLDKCHLHVLPCSRGGPDLFDEGSQQIFRMQWGYLTSSWVRPQGGLSFHPCYSPPQAPLESSMAATAIQRICSSLKPQLEDPGTCPARVVHLCLGSFPSMRGSPSSAGTPISSTQGSFSAASRKAFALVVHPTVR